MIHSVLIIPAFLAFSFILSLIILMFCSRRIQKRWRENIRFLEQGFQEIAGRHHQHLATALSTLFNSEHVKALIKKPDTPDITSSLLKKCGIQNFNTQIYNSSSIIINTFDELEKYMEQYRFNLRFFIINYLECLQTKKKSVFNLLQLSIKSVEPVTKAARAIIRMTNQKTLHNFTTQFQYFSQTLVDNLNSINTVMAEIGIQRSDFRTKIL